jgi:putative ABC transport system substrate-binding protein
MRRRDFIALVGGAAAGWPLAVRAQQSERMRHIGVLTSYADSDPEPKAWLAGFREALQQLGWTQGRNIEIDYRWAQGKLELMRRHAGELVVSKPDLIFSNNTPATEAVLQQTKAIPIVFASVSDPVGSGFVASLPRPGGNVTGFINIESSIATKWLGLLKEVAPGISRAVMLLDPDTATHADYYLDPFKAAAPSLGVEAISASVHNMAEVEKVIAAQAREPNCGLIATPSTLLNVNRAQVIALAARHRLPAVYPFRFYAESGGLLSYGSDNLDNYRRAASYVDRILRGTKPSELPVQVPVKYELAVNLKTAKALGLKIRDSFLLRADKVIE